MSINYKIKKAIVRIKQRNRVRIERNALKPLSFQQLKVYNTVIELAKTHQEAIKFDRKTDEILLIFPDKLITLSENTVRIDNTNKFYPINLPTEAYDLMVDYVSIEGHRERRRLKNEVKKNINKFLLEVSSMDDPHISTEFDEEIENESIK